MESNIFQKVLTENVAVDFDGNRSHDWVREVRAAEIKSMLPAPIDKGNIQIAWVHESSMQLGGDAFDYGWIDDNHFAIYLLDVCGHGCGVGPALLSIAVVNVLRERALPNTDFVDPVQVLNGLNEAFPMEEHKDMFFTIWYGVYNKLTRQIVYASGGHPPAVLITGETEESSKILELKTPGFVIGGMQGSQYQSATCEVGAFNKLFVFSDGVYEIKKPNEKMLELSEFINVLGQPSFPGVSDVERIKQFSKYVNSGNPFADDYSLIQVTFS